MDYFDVGQSTVSRWLSGKSRPEGEHRDLINALYEDLNKASERHHEISLPDHLAMKFFRMPEVRQNQVLGIFAAVLEVADWRD